jgi:hypothetical protein
MPLGNSRVAHGFGSTFGRRVGPGLARNDLDLFWYVFWPPWGSGSRGMMCRCCKCGVVGVSLPPSPTPSSIPLTPWPGCGTPSPEKRCDALAFDPCLLTTWTLSAPVQIGEHGPLDARLFLHPGGPFHQNSAFPCCMWVRIWPPYMRASCKSRD